MQNMLLHSRGASLNLGTVWVEGQDASGVRVSDQSCSQQYDLRRVIVLDSWHPDMLRLQVEEASSWTRFVVRTKDCPGQAMGQHLLVTLRPPQLDTWLLRQDISAVCEGLHLFCCSLRRRLGCPSRSSAVGIAHWVEEAFPASM